MHIHIFNTLVIGIKNISITTISDVSLTRLKTKKIMIISLRWFFVIKILWKTMISKFIPWQIFFMKYFLRYIQTLWSYNKLGKICKFLSMCFELSEKEFNLWRNMNKYHNLTLNHISRSKQDSKIKVLDIHHLLLQEKTRRILQERWIIRMRLFNSKDYLAINIQRTICKCNNTGKQSTNKQVNRKKIIVWMIIVLNF